MKLLVLDCPGGNHLPVAQGDGLRKRPGREQPKTSRRAGQRHLQVKFIEKWMLHTSSVC